MCHFYTGAHVSSRVCTLVRCGLVLCYCTKQSSSQQHDSQAIVYLSLLLLPAVLGFSLRSLVMER
jgi:ABC-type molybdate transport system permease subunit